MNNKSFPALPGIGEDEEYRGLPNIEKSTDLKNKGNFKRSGHITDQFLKYNYPKDKKPMLFNSLKPELKKRIETKGIEHSEIIEGIKLTPAETKVIDTLCKLLHHNSQTLKPNNKDYYTGNVTDIKRVNYGDSIAIVPQLTVTLYDLTKEYKAGARVSGKDLENVSKILLNISKKNFLIKYKEEINKKDGTKTVIEIEDYKPILNLPNFKITEYSKEGIITSKTESTLIELNPIFIRQIDTKFIVYPEDINKRTLIAYGNNNCSEATFTLREYLAKYLALKNYNPEIMIDRLYYLLAEKYMKSSRKSKVKQLTEKALDTMIKLGLLESFKIETAKTTGEPKIIFKINKNFE
ncbi:hypothetical protein [Tenacibaculum finnmarkense]|uniref:Uncharacterized protein n=1 Tax=Tenacibaculum finnmarkense genomovar ulcerans TaxID=2781388 RepID=A0A2I2MBI4_9FLAO|nr:hypothetical protein [Tenacibaculum finnmarkense]MCD8423540.1 hypothetical protein [Tenacibaculum finnmarkense genomovar ulcerans]MCD8447997.1 hypothetical protein [Tenacibaculum finnmarkense genomovar finnmarkense]MCG8239703.1 hypothetical protein [Tenacibaculum finnmarkense genomovar ulcerans]SOU89908.1 hypothetical protein TNO010_60017 [Tenacibaculum finnmarkense genomovar ulcerans]